MKKFSLLIFACVLAFALLGCGGGGGGGNDGLLDWLTPYLSTGMPNNQQRVGLSEAQYTQIRDSGGGGYLGWDFDYGDLVMWWSGRSVSNYNNIVSTLKNVFPGDSDQGSEDGFYWAGGEKWEIEFSTVTWTHEGITWPGGLLFVVVYGNY